MSKWVKRVLMFGWVMVDIILYIISIKHQVVLFPFGVCNFLLFYFSFRQLAKKYSKRQKAKLTTPTTGLTDDELALIPDEALTPEQFLQRYPLKEDKPFWKDDKPVKQLALSKYEGDYSYFLYTDGTGEEKYYNVYEHIYSRNAEYEAKIKPLTVEQINTHWDLAKIRRDWEDDLKIAKANIVLDQRSIKQYQTAFDKATIPDEMEEMRKYRNRYEAALIQDQAVVDTTTKQLQLLSECESNLN